MNSHGKLGWFSIGRQAWLTIVLELVALGLGIVGDAYTQRAMDCHSDPFILPTLGMAILGAASGLMLLVRCSIAKNVKAIALTVLLDIVCAAVGLGSVVASVGANLFCGLSF